LERSSLEEKWRVVLKPDAPLRKVDVVELRMAGVRCDKVNSRHVGAAELGWQMNERSVKSLRFFNSGITLAVQMEYL
jgi:hypothetical protein